MPGLDAAGSTPPPPTTQPEPEIADVVSLRGRRRPRAADRQEPPVNPARGDSPTPEEQLALTIEALYLHRRRTLTDPATAEAFDIAIEAATLVVDGTLAQGRITSEQHELLVGMLQAARRVPGIL